MTKITFLNKLETDGQVFFRAFAPIIDLFFNINHSKCVYRFVFNEKPCT